MPHVGEGVGGLPGGTAGDIYSASSPFGLVSRPLSVQHAWKGVPLFTNDGSSPSTLPRLHVSLLRVLGRDVYMLVMQRTVLILTAAPCDDIAQTAQSC